MLSRIAFLVLLSAAVINGLHAQTYEQVAPQVLRPNAPLPSLPEQPLPEGPSGDLDRVLAVALRGIVLLGDTQAMRRAGRNDLGVVVASDLRLLDTAPYRARIAPFLGQPLSLRLIEAVARETVLYLRAQDRPIVDVLILEQNISSGTVQLVVIEGRLGQVRVQGNQHFSTESLVSAVRLQPGEPILGSRLLEDIEWLNRNPFREVDLVFARGAAPGTTDVILRTTDRRPWRVYGGADNAGSAATGRERLLFGLNHGDVAGTGVQISYQFTGNLDFAGTVAAHAANAEIPLPWRHALDIFGSYGHSRPKLHDPVFQLQGTSSQLGVRYKIPLPATQGSAHELRAGFDFKRYDNNLAFGGKQVFTQSTDVAQFVLGYQWRHSGTRHGTRANLKLVLSPGGMGTYNKDALFENARVGAKARYHYLNLDWAHQRRIGRSLDWRSQIQTQWSDARLLGSEQMGFGGASSLRGYEEWARSGDGGVIWVNELDLPLHTQANRSLAGQIFLDLGQAWLRHPQPGERRRTTLASAGIGLHYRIDTRLSLRAAYGRQLRQLPGSHGKGAAHLKLLLAY